MQKVERIQFHYLIKGFHLANRTKLKRFVQKLIQLEGRKIENINYIFCPDKYLLELNKKYLHHNTLTDIITFEFSSLGQPLLSDIYISIERVRENAGNFKSSFNRELHRVIFHGALHLAGYKDKKISEFKKMRIMEDYYLHTYFVSRETKNLNKFA